MKDQITEQCMQVAAFCKGEMRIYIFIYICIKNWKDKLKKLTKLIKSWEKWKMGYRWGKVT